MGTNSGSPSSIAETFRSGTSSERMKRIQLFLYKWDVWILLVLMILLSSIITPLFYDPVNLENLLRQTTIIGVMTIGQFLVLLSAGFDLSIGSILALSSLLTAVYAGTGNYLALLLPLTAGAVIGLINGVVVSKFNVPAFIATIAMMGIARGLAFMVSGTSVMMTDEVLLGLDRTNIAFIPLPAILWFLIALVVYLILRMFKIGIYIPAVGGREATARLAGVNISRVRIFVFTMSGFLAGVAGILFVTRSSSGMPHVGAGWELDTIAAAVIGGTNLFGGEGSLPKAMAGVLIYMMIRNLMNIMGLDPFFQDLLKGAIILIAVGLRTMQARET